MKAHVTITENHARREELFTRLTTERARGGWAHQHELWPCVRKGAAERWLLTRGDLVGPSKQMALYFLRGKSAEGLIQDQNFPQLMIVVGGDGHEVAMTPDQWTGDPVKPFAELKSTNYSSFNFYKLLDAETGIGSIDMDQDFPMKNYFEQCAIYCAGLGVYECELWIYFLHGDYADRRTKCPACSSKLGGWDTDETRKVCPDCGYTAKKGDLWTYDVKFDPAYVRRMKAEIYTSRAPMFYAAIEATTEAEILTLAEPTQCFYCHNCKAGEAVGCENAGKVFK